MIRPRLVAAILLLLTLMAYLPVWDHGFIAFDDLDYIVNNRVVNQGLSWAGIKWAFTAWHASNWHPLTWISHMVDCELFGPNAGAHHLMSVLLHGINAVLFFYVLLQMTNAIFPAAIVAALFAWHPLHVESVAWASERKDVLSGMFWALTLLAYIQYVRKQKSPDAKLHTGSEIQNRGPSPRPSPHRMGRGRNVIRLLSSCMAGVFSSRDYWLALIFFALGLMAKPMLVTLPFVLVLLDYWPLKRAPNVIDWIKQVPRLTWEKAPFLLLTAGSCWITFQAQRGEAIVSLAALPLSTRIANAITAYAGYLVKIVWPVNLAALYPGSLHVNWLHVGLAMAALSAISVLVYRQKHRPYLLVGWLWFLGTLVPVIGLVQVGGQAMADRYTYIPSIGIFLMIAYGGSEMVKALRIDPRVPAACTGIILVACLIATRQQVHYWKDTEVLFRRAIAVTRDNPEAHSGLADALARKGRNEEAEQHFREAIRMGPWLVGARNDFAVFLESVNKKEEALQQYQEALRIKPNAPGIHCNLGILLVTLGRFDEAMAQYDAARQLEPNSPRPYCLMGKALLLQGRSAEAVALFRKALQRNANDSETLFALARVLAADPDSTLRNGPEAVTLAIRANSFAIGPDAGGLDVLAMAYAESGQYEMARQMAQNAIDLATALRQTNALPSLQEHLRLFQERQPIRETNASRQKL